MNGEAEGRRDDVLVLDCLRGTQAFWRVEGGASRPLMMDGSALPGNCQFLASLQRFSVTPLLACVQGATKNAAVSCGVCIYPELRQESQPSNFRTFVSAVMNRSISACVL